MVRERREQKQLGQSRWENIQREHLATQQTLKSEEDKNKAGDFQNPESECGQGKGDEELEQSREDQSQHKAEESGEAGRPEKIIHLVGQEQEHGASRRQGEDHPPGEEQAQPIADVADRPNQKLSYSSVLDLRRNLPIIFRN